MPVLICLISLYRVLPTAPRIELPPSLQVSPPCRKRSSSPYHSSDDGHSLVTHDYDEDEANNNQGISKRRTSEGWEAAPRRKVMKPSNHGNQHRHRTEHHHSHRDSDPQYAAVNGNHYQDEEKGKKHKLKKKRHSHSPKPSRREVKLHSAKEPV